MRSDEGPALPSTQWSRAGPSSLLTSPFSLHVLTELPRSGRARSGLLEKVSHAAALILYAPNRPDGLIV